MRGPPAGGGRPSGAVEAPQALELQLVHSFGSRCGTARQDVARFADAAGNYVLYPVGRHMCFRHVDSGSSAYLIESAQITEVVAVAMAPNRSVLAVCERTALTPSIQVTMYEVRNMGGQATCEAARTLQDLGKVGEVNCLALSAEPEAKYLVVASVAPELVLAVIEWRTNVVVGRFALRCQVDRVALSPWDDGVLSASCRDALLLWAFPGKSSGGAGGAGSPDAQLVPLDTPAGLREGAAEFADHAWVVDPADGTLVACTSGGRALVILARLSEPMRVLSRIDACLPVPGRPAPRCVRCFAGGFAFGGDDGAIAVWDMPPAAEDDEDASPQDSVAGIRLRGAGRALAPATGASAAPAVRALDMAVGGDDVDARVVLGFADNSVGILRLAVVRSWAVAAAPSGEAEVCELLDGVAHRAPITSMDMSIHRPLIVTASRQECAIRLWNYASCRGEMSCSFPGEEPTSVALHPLGYLVAVAFADKIRFLQVLVDGLRSYRDVPTRFARHLRFSSGGHLLAVAQGKSVLVLSCRSLGKVALLRGHSTQVVSLCFHPDDRTLTTCGEDGSFVEWSAQTWSRVREYGADRSLGAEARAVAVGGDARAAVALEEGGAHLVRFFQKCAPLESPDMVAPSEILSLWHHDSDEGMAVYGAGASGSLWWYVTGLAASSQELGLHVGACNDVRVSTDGKTIVTCGEDGVVFVLRIRGQDAPRGESEGDVVMINRGEMQLREEEIQQLLHEGAALKVRLVEESARMQSECVRRVAEARRKDQARIEVLRGECEGVQQTAIEQEREALRQMRATEAKHVEAADALEAKYEKTVFNEVEQYHSLEAEMRSLAERLVGAREGAAKTLAEHRARHQAELQARVGEKDAEIDRLRQLANFSKLRFDNMLDQEVMEQELEKTQLQTKTANLLEEQQMVEYRLKKEQDTILRGLDMMERDRDRAAREQYEQSIVVRNLKEEVEKLSNAVAALKNERRDREAALRDRELEIGAYKTKVNTLKKFKHVLDFRLHEVTLSLQPKDETIAQLSGQLKDLEHEFEARLEAQKQMEASLVDFDGKIKQKTSENARLRQTIQQMEQQIVEFMEDLHDLATKEQDLRKWPDGMRRMYKRHARVQKMARDLEMAPAMQELGRQIKATQRRAEALAATGRAAEDETRADVRQMVEENLELIQELDKLRKEKKELHSKMKGLELKVQQAEKGQVFGASPPQGGRRTPFGLMDAEAPDGQRPDSATGAVALPPPEGFFGAGATAQLVSPGPAPIDPAAGKLRRAGSQHRLKDERRQMQKLIAAVDSRTHQAQMQRLEHKLLQDKLDRLQRGAVGEARASAVSNVSGDIIVRAGTPSRPVAAGAGLAAARTASAAR